MDTTIAGAHETVAKTATKDTGAVRQLFRSRLVRTILTIAVGCLLIGVSFYEGRMMQNSADQQLINSFAPPRNASTTTGSGSTVSGPAATALASGNPPSGAAPAVKGPSGQSSAASHGEITVFGQWVGAARGTVTLQTIQGEQSVPASPQVRFYQAAVSSMAAAAVGSRVTVWTTDSGQQTGAAASVTIAPRGHLFAYVRSFGRGGFGRSGQLASLTGTITALHKGSFSLKTLQGDAWTITRSAATRVYGVRQISSSHVPAGSLVTVDETLAGGAPVATSVIHSAVAGTVASISSDTRPVAAAAADNQPGGQTGAGQAGAGQNN